MTYTTLISTRDLARRLDDPQWVIFDCRFHIARPESGREAYLDSHIPGAHYAHLERDLSSPVTAASGRHPLPAPVQLGRKLGRWGVDGLKQVVVYDDATGPFAARMWWLLRWLGHQAVAVLEGGLRQWCAEDLPVTPQLPVAPGGEFPVHVDSAGWVTTAFVVQNLTAQGYAVVDARAAERYAGEAEPLDAVAGHVPGALNRPYTGNLDPSGCLLPGADLRAAFRALIGDTPPSRVIHMCGSGVTACHNLLAMEAAGLGGSKLYPGSWSEWIRDPERPIAKGFR